MSIPKLEVVHNWRGLEYKSGTYPIDLRITIKSKQKYFPIKVPLKVRHDQWSGKEGAWVKNNHPFAFEINNKIKETKTIVDRLTGRYYTFNQTLTFPIIFRELKKTANTNSFNQFFKNYNDHPTDGVEPDTLKKYRACLDHLNTFNPEIKFQDLTPELVEAFYQYCKTKALDGKGLKGSTIDSYFDAFRKIVGLARKDHQISKELEDTLFEDLKIQVNKSNRTFLTIEEIRLWKNARFTAEEAHLARTRDQFLLQIYTGFYYKDLIGLKKEYLVKDHEHGYMILGERDKNDEQNIIPLFRFPEANRLMEKFASKDPDSPYVFDRNYFLAEPVYNRQLKEVAKRAKIHKGVSNKVARHSNAQMWIRLGAEKPVVKQMMGHAKEQTTEVYYRVDVTEVIEGTKHVNFKELGI